MLLRVVSLLFILAVLASTAHATTTICSDAEWKKFHYGVKASMQVRMPHLGPDAINDTVKAYAAKKGLTYAAVGSFSPYKKPPLKKLTQYLQSKSSDVEITIDTSDRDNIATISIKTFSYSCGATEDWRPYWTDFRAFVVSQGYPRVPE